MLMEERQSQGQVQAQTRLAASGVVAIAMAQLGAIAAATSRLQDLCWSSLSEAELLDVTREADTAFRASGGVRVRLAGEIEARGVDGELRSATRSPAHLLSELLRITLGEARGLIAAAAAGLASQTLAGTPIPALMPALVAALDAGQIGVDHSKVITDCLAKLPHAVDGQTRALCAEVLLDEAAARDSNALRTIAETIRLICDPDGKLSGKEPADRAELWFGGLRSDGLTPVRGLLDALTMERLRVAVEDLSAPQPLNDGTPDPRPASLRRAQALGEVLRRYARSAPCGPGDGGPRQQVGVTIHVADLRPAGAGGSGGAAGAGGSGGSGGSAGTALRRTGVGVFDYGVPVSIATARMLACDGDLITLLLGADGAIVDEGRAQRLFTRAQRRALTVRDRGCAFPGCDIPAGWCEAHHITYWQNGGTSDLANGLLLCGRHHAVIHREEWAITPSSTPRGRPAFIPPAYIDPARKSRHNRHFHLPEILSAVRRQ